MLYKKQIMKNDHHQTLQKALELHREGRLDDAEEMYRSILSQDASQTDALHMLGVLLCQRGDAGEGIPLLEKALYMKPDMPAYRCNLANALHDVLRYEEALLRAREAIALKPDYAEAHFIAGLCQAALGRIDAAMSSYREAIRINPSLARAQNNLGILLMEQGDLKDAAACFESAIRTSPSYAQAHNNLGNLYKNRGLPSTSVSCFEKALSISPEYADAHSNLAGALKDLGRTDEALSRYQKALHLDPENPVHLSNYLLTLHYRDDASPQELFRAHRSWAERYEPDPALHPAKHKNTPEPARVLRIGYISGDFRTHSVAYFIEPVLASHNSDDFDLFCYSDVTAPDETTHQLRGLVKHWRDVSRLSPPEIMDLIRQDRIDILVELSGHTSTRILQVCTGKPSPVQISYLGYPDTTGLRSMDYRITDDEADPPGITDECSTESLLRIEPCFLCYRPPGGTPEPAGPPCRAAGHITFGSFNNRAKITPSAVLLWSRILHALPGSTIMLKATTLGDDGARHELLRQFADAGIDPGRLSIKAYLSSKHDHFDLYNQIDIALDTFPYNGTTTTLEALWMGVPVITLAGPIHASRVGSSILGCLGLEDLVARSHDDYARTALALAQDRGRLAELRSGLRRRLEDSPLMDGRGFTAKIEACCRSVWQEWCLNHIASGEPSPGEPGPRGKSAADVHGLILEGEALFSSGRLPEAEKVFLRALDMEPDNVVLLNDLGVVSWHRGETGRARDYLNRVLALDPGNADALANLDAMEDTGPV